jgi:hypothetical protein
MMVKRKSLPLEGRVDWRVRAGTGGVARAALDGLFAPRASSFDPLWLLRGHLPLKGGE